MPCKGLKQSGPLQHHRGLLKEIHRYLKKGLTPESTNSNKPSDRDARHRSTNVARTPTPSDSGGNDIAVIRRGITSLVCLNKDQDRRYYRLRRIQWIQPVHFFLRYHLLWLFGSV